MEPFDARSSMRRIYTRVEYYRKQSPRARRAAFTLQTALMVMIAVGVLGMYFYLINNMAPVKRTHRLNGRVRSRDPANRYAAVAGGGGAGVRPFSEEHLAVAFAKETADEEKTRLVTKPFAYVFYVTNDAYACAALHAMHTLRTKLQMDVARIDFVVLYSDELSDNILQRMQSVVMARTILVERILADVADPTWQASLTKLRAFEEWGYQRVVFLDSDAVPQQNLDHLFELPRATLYAPTAYWLAQPFFTTTLMVIEPSNQRFREIIQWAAERGESAGHDMDVLNAMFKHEVQYLAADYTVLNSDFRARPEAKNQLYPTTLELRRRAKLVHFSCGPDGEYGKPWTAQGYDMSLLLRDGIDPFFGELFEDYWRSVERLCM